MRRWEWVLSAVGHGSCERPGREFCARNVLLFVLLFFHVCFSTVLLFLCYCLFVHACLSMCIVLLLLCVFFMFVFPFFRTSQIRSSSTSQESSKWTIRSHFGPMALVRRLAWVKKGHAWVWFTWTEQMFSEAKNRIVGKTFSARRRFCHGCALE